MKNNKDIYSEKMFEDNKEKPSVIYQFFKRPNKSRDSLKYSHDLLKECKISCKSIKIEIEEMEDMFRNSYQKDDLSL